ncbi:ATP-binding cassette domain-containing protein [Streptomyces phaeochromogenes]|uniref:ATP-binding cassette domain-containing protein n=1 Tax=Streptomyces phaeochromogenes TaxID=1923 RepID=UPI002DD93DFB|nr:ATP-binding cassette domain-containing protein [Streptomyces phaeochromogenes]
MPQPLLEIRGLTVTYQSRRRRGTPKVAVDGVDLTISAGETLGLVGESGSGKSTIGNAVLGLVPITGGTITFDGRDITHLHRTERRQLSQEIEAVFQDPYSSFNPHRTVGQTVSETLTTQAGLNKNDIRERVANMLERVGLDGTAMSRFPAQFSGGQRQRIAIARALLPLPRLVVCDESVSALDLSVQAQVLNLLAELQRDLGVAYLFITHDLSVVRHVSNRVAVLHQGILVEQGTNKQVIDTPQQAYTQALLSASPLPDPEVQGIRREARRALSSLTRTHAPGEDEASLSSLISWRKQLERKAAYEAAKSGRTAPVALMAEAVERMEVTDDPQEFHDADIAFHQALFAASSSAAPAVLPDALEALLARTVQGGPGNSSVSHDREYVRQLHRDVYEAVAEGDTAKALHAVDEHFQWLAKALAPVS